MNKILLLIISLLICSVFTACEQKTENKKTEIPISFSDSEMDSIPNYIVKDSIKEEMPLNPTDYVKWVNINSIKLSNSASIQNVEYSIEFIPEEYDLLRSMQKNDDTMRILKNWKKDEKIHQYLFKIRPTNFRENFMKYNCESTKEYENRLKYFTFNIYKDIFLIEGSDTLNCLSSTLEQSFEISPFGSFILSFPVNNKKNNEKLWDKIFLYRDRIYNYRNIYLKIEARNYYQIPSIKINNYVK